VVDRLRGSIGAFYYRGRLVEAQVVRPLAAADERQDPRLVRPYWTMSFDGEKFSLFPASIDDTEELVRKRIKHWIDYHLAGEP
jgi:hypothetical protein